MVNVVASQETDMLICQLKLQITLDSFKAVKVTSQQTAVTVSVRKEPHSSVRTRLLSSGHCTYFFGKCPVLDTIQCDAIEIGG